MSNNKQYWRVSGGRLKRPRTMKRTTLVEYALKKGLDGDSLGWIFPTNVVVDFLREQGYHVQHVVLDDEDDEC